MEAWREARHGGRQGVDGGKAWMEARRGGRQGMEGGKAWMEARCGWRQGMERGKAWRETRHGGRQGMERGEARLAGRPGERGKAIRCQLDARDEAIKATSTEAGKEWYDDSSQAEAKAIFMAINAF